MQPAARARTRIAGTFLRASCLVQRHLRWVRSYVDTESGTVSRTTTASPCRVDGHIAFTLLRMRLLRRGALALAFCHATTAAAQTTVRGQLTDSLTHRVFNGARVQLVSQKDPSAEGQRVESDSLGAFVFTGVAPGSHLLGFEHPRLDSLGMDAVLRSITIPEGVTTLHADLGLPSARYLAGTLCEALRDTTGVIIGRARDARTGMGHGGARISATWGELVMDARTVRNASAEVSTVAAADGRYVLCGVPTDAAVLLQVRGGASDTNHVESGIDVAFPPDVPLVHRDLLVSDGTERRTRIIGRVLRPDGIPLTGARVRVRGDPATVVTDSAGTFMLDGAPAGTRTLEAIALGFSPARVPVDVYVGKASRADITMQTAATTLETMKVRAFASRDARDYLARAQRNRVGFFLSGDEVRRRGQTLVSFALLKAPLMRALDTKFGRPVLSGPRGCTPSFFVDGWEIEADELDRAISVASLGGIEVYRHPGEVPSQLGLRVPVGVRGQCLMVFVWSKSLVNSGM